MATYLKLGVLLSIDESGLMIEVYFLYKSLIPIMRKNPTKMQKMPTPMKIHFKSKPLESWINPVVPVMIANAPITFYYIIHDVR